MEYADNKILEFTLCCIFTVTAFMMLMLQRKVPSIKGPFYWGIGSLLLVTGMLLYLSHSISEFGAYVLGGVVIISGWLFYLIGLWKFKNVKINYWIVITFPLLQLLQGTFFLYIIPIPYIRIANYSILVAILSIYTAVEFFKPSKAYLRHSLILGGIVFVLRTLIVLPRAFFALYTKQGNAVEITLVYNLLLISSIILILVIFAVFISITFQKQVEQTRKQADIKNRLFNIIAHDLKGPVGNIAEFLKLINSSNAIPITEQKPILRKLEKLSISTSELLNNLLLWSNSTKEKFVPKYESIDVTKCIDENIDLFEESAKKKNVSIERCSTKDVFCLADHAMFHTVIRNLLANAIKFSEAGNKVKLNCVSHNNTCKITISDEGVGIANDKLQDFNEGKNIDSTKGTNDEHGTGIGLVLCRDFIRSNKGEMIIKSQVQKGTEVTLLLPSV